MLTSEEKDALEAMMQRENKSTAGVTSIQIEIQTIPFWQDLERRGFVVFQVVIGGPPFVNVSEAGRMALTR